MTFASVHDSYWTHACDVTEMSTVIRDTFIALHSSNVLRRLSEEVSVSDVAQTPVALTFGDQFHERYQGYKVPITFLTGSTAPTSLHLPPEVTELLKSKKEAAAARANGEKTAQDKLNEKYVDLVDLLPPLPKSTLR